MLQELDQILWQELRDALALPQHADLKRLCQLFDRAIAQLPESQQLTAAGQAISQIAVVYALKADWLMATWEATPDSSDLALPVLPTEVLEGWIRQSMSIDLDALVEPSLSQRNRREPRLQPTESIAAVVDQTSLLAMLDQMEIEPDPEQMVRQLAGEEDPVQWSAAISQWLTEHQSVQPIHLSHLYSELGLPWVELWMGLILGDFELVQIGDFYSSNVWIKL